MMKKKTNQSDPIAYCFFRLKIDNIPNTIQTNQTTLTFRLFSQLIETAENKFDLLQTRQQQHIFLTSERFSVWYMNHSHAAVMYFPTTCRFINFYCIFVLGTVSPSKGN